MHKASLNPSLEIIKSLKKNYFYTTKNIKNNISFYINTNKNNCNVGREISSTLKNHHSDVLHQSVCDYSNEVNFFAKQLKFTAEFDPGLQNGINFILQNISNKFSIIEQLKNFHISNIDTNFICEILCRNTHELEVPILMNLHSLMEFQLHISVLTLNYYFIVLLGPHCFLGSYFLLDDSNNLKKILKDSIYIHCINRDYKKFYKLVQIPELPFEVNRAKCNLILVMLGGGFVCNGFGINSPKITSIDLNSKLI